MEKRLFIVSNRLPITVSEENEVRPASGGLVSAISSYLNQGASQFDTVLWAGVPGCDTVTWNAASRKMEEQEYNYLPVFIPQFCYENYYNGHSNSVLWPLFHYFPSYAEYNVECYQDYLRANEQFAETMIPHLRLNDTVWIHDYHLLPLAGLLRAAMPDLSIGFFLHIPFPSFEIFRLLPKKWQEDILKGLLGADLIGFHTIDYASHFLQTVLTVLGLDNERHVINYENRLIKVDVFPISIDFNKFNNAYNLEAVTEKREHLIQKMNNRKIIFSVDRLDYTKGVRNRLKAFETFLRKHPEYHERVVFIMVIVPSRDSIPKYAERKRIIDELISNINSKIGNIHWMPVIYQYAYLDFEEILGLYTACDLALITPLRDGMNLVSKEFVASRKDQRGVLILSEMAGAARELTDALIINPNDIIDMAEKINEGLQMAEEEQRTRLNGMQQRVADYDVRTWAEDFVTELMHIKKRQQTFQVKFIDNYSKHNLYDAYRMADKRLLLLDYDGTLVPFAAMPDLAVPGPQVMNTLKNLSATEENDVFLISGRSSNWLQQHFGGLNIHLIAEHGAKYKWHSGEWKTDIQIREGWKDRVLQIMNMYVRRCPNSFVEEKEFSLVWHYRNANVEQGNLRAFELTGELKDCVSTDLLQVTNGHKIVEVRQSTVNKGYFVKKIIESNCYDFVFAAGDDKTDEDMFRQLMGKSGSFTVKVGSEASYAQFNLHTPQMILSLLEGMNHISSPLLIQ